MIGKAVLIIGLFFAFLSLLTVFAYNEFSLDKRVALIAVFNRFGLLRNNIVNPREWFLN